MVFGANKSLPDECPPPLQDVTNLLIRCSSGVYRKDYFLLVARSCVTLLVQFARVLPKCGGRKDTLRQAQVDHQDPRKAPQRRISGENKEKGVMALAWLIEALETPALYIRLRSLMVVNRWEEVSRTLRNPNISRRLGTAAISQAEHFWHLSLSLYEPSHGRKKILPEPCLEPLSYDTSLFP